MTNIDASSRWAAERQYGWNGQLAASLRMENYCELTEADFDFGWTAGRHHERVTGAQWHLRDRVLISGQPVIRRVYVRRALIDGFDLDTDRGASSWRKRAACA